ncbi:MAG: TerB family tellurite resistance protein [Halioglobus sp.]
MKSKFALRLRDLIDKIVGEKSRVSPEQRQQALDMSLAVMALVAAADESIDDSEVVAVQELYAKYGGGLVDNATVRKAFNIVVSDQASTWRQLNAANGLSSEVREDIFAVALQVARADSNVHQQESALLRRIGIALGLAQTRIDDLCGSD